MEDNYKVNCRHNLPNYEISFLRLRYQVLLGKKKKKKIDSISWLISLDLKKNPCREDSLWKHWCVAHGREQKMTEFLPFKKNTTLSQTYWKSLIWKERSSSYAAYQDPSFHAFWSHTTLVRCEFWAVSLLPLRAFEAAGKQLWVLVLLLLFCLYFFLISFFPFFILFDFTRHYRRVFYWFFFFFLDAFPGKPLTGLPLPWASFYDHLR